MRQRGMGRGGCKMAGKAVQDALGGGGWAGGQEVRAGQGRSNGGRWEG